LEVLVLNPTAGIIRMDYGEAKESLVEKVTHAVVEAIRGQEARAGEFPGRLCFTGFEEFEDTNGEE
jgi:hypothetical protein